MPDEEHKIKWAPIHDLLYSLICISFFADQEIDDNMGRYEDPSFSFDIELLVDFEDHLCHFDCLASKQTRQFKLETISKSIRVVTISETISTDAE